MPSLAQRATGAWTRARARLPLLDHLVRTFEHYSGVNGSMLAGGVTYFAFLSFFPILALAFFVVGYVARIYPGAQADLIKGINEVLPGMIGNDPGQISLSAISKHGGAAGVVGVAGLLYSGLSWVSGMRTALLAVFDKPSDEQPNFVVGLLRDLVTLVVIGLTLIVSVAMASVVTGYSKSILDLVGLGAELRPALTVISVLIGLAANMLLFFAMFRLLADPDLRTRTLWKGAFLGAIGFELLKWASTYLMASTKSQPAFQAFGIALILLVWIYYFSRVVLYAAAWAHTAERPTTHHPKANSAPVRGQERTGERPASDASALAARVEHARCTPPAELGAPTAPAAHLESGMSAHAPGLALGAVLGFLVAWLLRRSR